MLLLALILVCVVGVSIGLDHKYSEYALVHTLLGHCQGLLALIWLLSMAVEACAELLGGIVAGAVVSDIELRSRVKYLLWLLCEFQGWLACCAPMLKNQGVLLLSRPWMNRCDRGQGRE